MLLEVRGEYRFGDLFVDVCLDGLRFDLDSLFFCWLDYFVDRGGLFYIVWLLFYVDLSDFEFLLVFLVFDVFVVLYFLLRGRVEVGWFGYWLRRDDVE